MKGSILVKVSVMVFLCAGITACHAQSKQNSNVPPPVSSEQWAYRFVTWSDTVYEITDETVQKSRVGKVIGEVQKNKILKKTVSFLGMIIRRLRRITAIQITCLSVPNYMKSQG